MLLGCVQSRRPSSVTLQSQVGHGGSGSVDDDHARASADRRLGISPQEGAMHPRAGDESIQGDREEMEERVSRSK